MQRTAQRIEYRPRLLLVEDDRLVSETICAMLEDRYDVAALQTVAAALAALVTEPPPCAVLADCLLPGGGVRSLLTEADRLGIAVVLTSGDLRASARVDPLRPFVAKPFHQDTLLKVLDALA
jgi:DNA-binding NtrC family response regulator